MYFLNIDKSDMVEFVMRPYIIQKTGKFLIDDNFELGFTRDDLVDALNYAARLYTENVAVPAAEGNTFLNATWTNPDWINGKLTSRLSWTSLLQVKRQILKIPLYPQDFPCVRMQRTHLWW